jgi:hypothetical protein
MLISRVVRRKAKSPKSKISISRCNKNRKPRVEAKQPVDKDKINASMPKQIREDISRYVPSHRFVSFPQD